MDKERKKWVVKHVRMAIATPVAPTSVYAGGCATQEH